MSNLEQISIQSKSLGENLPLEGNQQISRKHSHNETNAEILTSKGVERVYLNRRTAIKFKCMDCSGFEYVEMRNCPYKDCSLWQFRTGKGNQKPSSRNRAIKTLCMECMCNQPYEITNCTSRNCPLYIFRGYVTIENDGLNKDSCSKSATGGIPDDLSFKSDSKIPYEVSNL